jgi:hypothetical protein
MNVSIVYSVEKTLTARRLNNKRHSIPANPATADASDTIPAGELIARLGAPNIHGMVKLDWKGLRI